MYAGHLWQSIKALDKVLEIIDRTTNMPMDNFLPLKRHDRRDRLDPRTPRDFGEQLDIDRDKIDVFMVLGEGLKPGCESETGFGEGLLEVDDDLAAGGDECLELGCGFDIADHCVGEGEG